jgi:GntR family transcriptional repressor for pyruvate dehydrogenase complex
MPGAIVTNIYKILTIIIITIKNMSVKTLPDQITDLLIALVFVGKLLPGDKLPPERQLAEHLGVDRTSLRMALKTLTRMNIINTIQGSGIRVLDYKVDGGLDFLANLYQINELELGGDLLLAGLEMFNRAIPSAIKMSIEKSVEEFQAEILSIIHKMYQSMEQGLDIRELARLDVQLVDNLLSSTGNIFMQLAGGSSRQIRIALTEKSYELIDVKKHLDWLVNMMMRIASGMLAMDDMVREYNQYMDDTSEPLKQYLMTLPTGPKLKASPLHNNKNIMDLDDIMRKTSAPKF